MTPLEELKKELYGFITKDDKGNFLVQNHDSSILDRAFKLGVEATVERVKSAFASSPAAKDEYDLGLRCKKAAESLLEELE